MAHRTGTPGLCRLFIHRVDIVHLLDPDPARHVATARADTPEGPHDRHNLRSMTHGLITVDRVTAAATAASFIAIAWQAFLTRRAVEEQKDFQLEAVKTRLEQRGPRVSAQVDSVSPESCRGHHPKRLAPGVRTRRALCASRRRCHNSVAVRGHHCAKSGTEHGHCELGVAAEAL